jgi:hypothetical protein
MIGISEYMKEQSMSAHVSQTWRVKKYPLWDQEDGDLVRKVISSRESQFLDTYICKGIFEYKL